MVSESNTVLITKITVLQERIISFLEIHFQCFNYILGAFRRDKETYLLIIL